jgi:hypothetical protein
MQQVLAAPKMPSKTPTPIADNGGYPVSRVHQRGVRHRELAEKIRGPIAWLRSLKYLFTYPESQHLAACVDTKAQYDSALGHISRVDPYLYIKSLSG